MGKIVDFLAKVGKKENPYRDYSIEELEKKKADLQKQREFCGDATIMTDRGYSKRFDGHPLGRQHEDVYLIQIRSIDREINKIDTELRLRKEQECAGIEPGRD